MGGSSTTAGPILYQVARSCWARSQLHDGVGSLHLRILLIKSQCQMVVMERSGKGKDRARGQKGAYDCVFLCQLVRILQ